MTITTENYSAEVNVADAAIRMHDDAVAAYESGDGGRAESLMLRSLKMLEDAEGPSSPDVAAILSDLGAIYENRSDYTRAERLYKKAVNIIMMALGDGTDVQELRLRSLSNLGRIHRTMGEYYKAEMLFLQAITIADQSFGVGSLQMAAALNNLGMLYKYMARFDEAESL
jgi:tetratricopeptide (TPR) repeat protein